MTDQSPSQVPAGAKRVMSGHLDEVDLFSVVQFLMLQQKTGILVIRTQQQQATASFDSGQLVNVEDGRGGDPEEAAFRVFGWKKGDFDFYALPNKPERRIHKDTETLLLELAVKIDHQAAAETKTEQKPTAKEERKPVVARLVRRAVPASQQPPDYTPLSETQLIRNVQSKLIIYHEDLPEELGRDYRKHLGVKRRVGSQRGLKPIVLVVVSCCVVAFSLFAIYSILREQGNEKPSRPKTAPLRKRPAATEEKATPAAAMPYKFVTKPGTPGRRIENAIKDTQLTSTVAVVSVTKGDNPAVTIILRRHAYWDLQELKRAATSDAAKVIAAIFDKLPDIAAITLKVQSHITSASSDDWENALVVKAGREKYNPGMRASNAFGLISRFKHTYHPKLK